MILSHIDGKYLLSRHRARTTWETQGGHIELGETPLEFSILHKAIRIVVSKEFYDKRPETSCSCTVPEV